MYVIIMANIRIQTKEYDIRFKMFRLQPVNIWLLVDDDWALTLLNDEQERKRMSYLFACACVEFSKNYTFLSVTNTQTNERTD